MVTVHHLTTEKLVSNYVTLPITTALSGSFTPKVLLIKFNTLNGVQGTKLDSPL